MKHLFMIFLLLGLSGCSGPTAFNSNSASSISGPGTATLLWDPNSESDLASYRIYYGLSEQNMSVKATIPAVNNPTYKVDNLASGKTFYFKVTAINTAGQESNASNTVSKLIQ